MGNIIRQTSYLYAVPDFMSGMAHALDLGSTLQAYNESPTAEADLKALKSDWQAVGHDILNSMIKYEKEK